MRIFIAIELPQAIKQEIGAIQEQLKRVWFKARWVKASSLHLTLKFLGEVNERGVAEICQHLEDIGGGFSPFTLRLTGGGAFPNLRRPRVFWVGLEGELAFLYQLAEKVEGAMSAQGFPGEKRPFAPHITLARSPSPKGEKASILGDKLLEESRGGDFVVTSIFLVKSDLRPTGAVYRNLAEFSLSKKP